MAQKLHEALALIIPNGSACHIRYIHTPPKLCDALFSPPPGHDPEKTRLASHFLAVSTDVASASGTSSISETDVLFLGIEVLIYTTRHLTTIFVSKADSTGYQSSRHSVPIRSIATTFLDWLTNQQRLKRPNRPIVISLFARAQAQYLFSASSDNGKKHVLDDRQLIKWWAKVLDPILSRRTDPYVEESTGAWVTVPGYEGSELRQFFPPSSQTPQLWKAGNPLGMLAETRRIGDNVTPRTLLPRFPDDPKARFMQDLDDEVGMSTDAANVSPTKQKGGKWKNISNLDRFWEAMEFRQECSSGRMVGFLWLVITPQGGFGSDDKFIDSQESSKSVSVIPPTSDPMSPTPKHTTKGDESPKKRRRAKLTGPIMPRQPRLKGGSSSSFNAGSTTASDLNRMLAGANDDGLILTKDGYDQAIQTLLNLDFGTLDMAGRSTSKWIDEVRSIGGLSSDWAVTIQGIVTPAVNIQKDASRSSHGHINDLGSMVRKKRKAVDGEVTGSNGAIKVRVEEATNGGPAVNVLGAGMVRKKPKATVT